MVLLIFALGNLKIGAMKPIFSIGFWFPQGGRGVRIRACVGMVFYHCIVHIYFKKFKGKKSIFFVSNSNLCSCRAMLPNYLRTYLSALCQIRALSLEKPFKKKNTAIVYQNLGFECMHAIKFDWPEKTLKIYMQYSTYFACNNVIPLRRVSFKFFLLLHI